MARKLPKSLESWLIPKLRRISLYWPGKTIARDNAKVYVDDGNFKNGKPKTKVMYQCNECRQIFEQHETAMDHIKSVIGPEGFKDWNTYIEALFCDPSNFQCLCRRCHLVKSKGENNIRLKKKRVYKK